MSGFSHTGIIRRVAEYQAETTVFSEVLLGSLREDLLDWDLNGLQAESDSVIEGLTALGERGTATLEYLTLATTGVRRLFWIGISIEVSARIASQRIQARFASRVSLAA